MDLPLPRGSWGHEPWIIEQFITHVETMDDTKLDAVFVDEKYGTYQQNIEGVIEHCYYHLPPGADFTSKKTY